MQALEEIRTVCGSLREQLAAASQRSAEAATAAKECLQQAEEAAAAAAAEKERQLERLRRAEEAAAAATAEKALQLERLRQVAAAAAAEKDCKHAKVSGLAAKQAHQAQRTYSMALLCDRMHAVVVTSLTAGFGFTKHAFRWAFCSSAPSYMLQGFPSFLIHDSLLSCGHT
jgi:hypothetical protein